LLLTLTTSRLHADPVDFVREVRPLLEEHCLRCHGPEKQKSGYRVDVKSIALTGGESHAPNIVPGDTARSPLLTFIAGSDPDLRMPPKGDLLSPAQQQILSRWIAEGAHWPEEASAKIAAPTDWWSLRPLQKTTPPKGAPHPIDAFVAERLQRESLAASPRADAATLCRRLYFDLTGLPPSPEQLDAFLSDPSPSAFARLADELLASPRYGERWARHWLDVVHYGDTHGYDKDKPRLNAWPYRDYVIRSLNADKPYAQFVREQIAGDVLFPNSTDGLEALGFLAAGPWDFIGHAEVPETKTDGKIARHLDRDDMVANTIGTFCATTVHCAQCHNHKFDPIPQEDYYAFQAVFAALDRTDVRYFDDPALTAAYRPLPTLQRKAADRVAALQKDLEKDAGPELAKIDAALKAARQPGTAKGRPEYGYHSSIEKTQERTKWVQVDLGRTVPIQRIVFTACDDDFNHIGPGFGFPVRYKLEISDDPDFARDVHLLMDRTGSDQANPGTTPQTAEAQGAQARYIRMTATKLAPRKDDFIFALAELEAFDESGANLALGGRVTSLDSIESGQRWSRKNLTDGISPLKSTTTAKTVAQLEKERTELLLAKATPKIRADLDAAKAEQARLTEKMKTFPPGKTAYVGSIHYGTGSFKGTGPDDGKPRPIFLLARGQVTQPGREVAPGALSALHFQPARFALDPAAPESARRAALAEWIAHPENPLTWRTIVNRVWHYHFGAGLVETPGDFGRNGALPSHPELLEWLASEFRDSGGSLKALHRLIVTSAVYQQASISRPDAQARDANNRLLWRQNRRKLEAEAVRDATLAASGALDLTMGGPGWQDFVVERPEHSPHYRYDLHDPADPKCHRRAVYRFAVRSQTQPWLTSLDCADPSMRVDRRNESLSALQALALLNDGFILFQSSTLAARALRDTGASGDADSKAAVSDTQVRRAFRLAISREPSMQELSQLTTYARQHGLPATCRLLLNLNEFSFVD